jgi:hypothetical protein
MATLTLICVGVFLANNAHAQKYAQRASVLTLAHYTGCNSP